MIGVIGNNLLIILTFSIKWNFHRRAEGGMVAKHDFASSFQSYEQWTQL